MGPNSNRARKNNTINLNAPARARFSNWRPTSKKPNGRGPRSNNNNEDDRNGTSSSQTSDTLKQKRVTTTLTVVKPMSYVERLPKGMTIDSFSEINIPDDILEKLLMELDYLDESIGNNNDINCKNVVSLSTDHNTGYVDMDEVEYDDDYDNEMDSNIKYKANNNNNNNNNNNSIQKVETIVKDYQSIETTSNYCNKTELLKSTAKTIIKEESQYTPDSKVLSKFIAIGFYRNEIQFIFDHLKCVNLDTDEVYIALLVFVYHTCVSPLDFFESLANNNSNKSNNNNNNNVYNKISELNKELIEEMSVLDSIFEGCISVRFSHLLGESCVSIDFIVQPSAEIRCDKPITIRIFIFKALKYPNSECRVLGWISMDNNNNSINDNSEAIRRLSIEGMAYINGLLGNDTPVIFDFISFFQTNLVAIVGNSNSSNSSNNNYNSSNNNVGKNRELFFKSDNNNKNELDNNSKKNDNSKDRSFAQNDKKLDKNNNNKSKEMLNKKDSKEMEAITDKDSKITQDNQNKDSKVKSLVPKVNYSTIPEYRVALLEALNKGLAGLAAKLEAVRNLEYVLPTSVLDFIRIEIQLEEDLLDRSVDIEQLGTRGEIEAIKLLMSEIDLPKIKAKALLGVAKKNLIEENRRKARTVDKMKLLWVEEAVNCFLKRQEKTREKQFKRKQQGSVVTGKKVMTIRDAYEKMEQSKASQSLQLSAPSSGLEECENESELLEDTEALVVEKEKQNPVTTKTSGNESDKGIKFTAGQCESVRSMRNSNANRSSNNNNNVKMNSSDVNQSMLSEMKRKKSSPKYKTMLKVRSSLPAYDMRKEIVETIKNNRVIIICGAPGCGKTTQVPQFVLDTAIEEGNGSQVNMLITQPRRISAISTAERIAEERVESIGNTAGYHIRLELKKSANTRILLMTTGVLLRKLQSEDDLSGISHIFVDEVHERDLQTDFLLIVLKLIIKKQPDLKIVCMSATVNSQLFVDYFKAEKCAKITIPGRSFPVQTFFLEEAIEQCHYELDSKSTCIFKVSPKLSMADKRKQMNDRTSRSKLIEQQFKGKFSQPTMKALDILDEGLLNIELIKKIVLMIVEKDDCSENGNSGAILIFVAGIGDIRDVIQVLNNTPHLFQGTITTKIFPLHSSLSSAEQNKVFNVYPPTTTRKIIVSTNIAETSVTIPDVVYVIDTARVKQNRYDSTSQLSVLEETFISKANAMQRGGRAGRVKAGICYRLVSSINYATLPDYTVPEMLRLSLEELILQVLALDLGDPYTFLASALSPPDKENISIALTFLENLNAVQLEEETDGNNVNEASQSISTLTPLGYHLASLPINPRIGKLIFYGLVMKCIDPILTIAAIVSAKSPFISPFDPVEREKADNARLFFSTCDSDLMTMMNAYDYYINNIKSDSGRSRGHNNNNRNRNTIDQCSKHYLSEYSLDLIHQMREQFIDLLKDIGFLPNEIKVNNISCSPENRNGTNYGMIKAVLCAGISPNIATLSVNKDTGGKRYSELQFSSHRGNVSLHPSSILYNMKSNNKNNYFLYLEAVQTAKLYARDVTIVSPLLCVLFSSKMTIYNTLGCVVIDNWLGFKIKPIFARIIMRIRKDLEESLVDKILDPMSTEEEDIEQLNDNEKENKFNTVLRLIEMLIEIS